MPPILCFLDLFSAAIITYFLMLSRLSLFLIRSEFGGEFFSPVWCIIFCFHCVLLKQFFETFQIFFLTFGIENFERIPFGSGIFGTGYPIKALYGISTTYTLWSPIPDHIGINISEWRSISFVSHILSIWFLPLTWMYVPFFPVLVFIIYLY